MSYIPVYPANKHVSIRDNPAECLHWYVNVMIPSTRWLHGTLRSEWSHLLIFAKVKHPGFRLLTVTVSCGHPSKYWTGSSVFDLSLSSRNRCFQRYLTQSYCIAGVILTKRDTTLYSVVGMFVTSFYVARMKIHWLTEIFLCNVTKWSLFFNIVLLRDNPILCSLLQCLDAIG